MIGVNLDTRKGYFRPRRLRAFRAILEISCEGARLRNRSLRAHGRSIRSADLNRRQRPLEPVCSTYTTVLTPHTEWLYVIYYNCLQQLHASHFSAVKKIVNRCVLKC